MKNDSNQAYETRKYWPASFEDLESTSDASSLSGDFKPAETANHYQDRPAQDDAIRAAPVASDADTVETPLSRIAPAIQQPCSFEDPDPREQSFRDFWRFFFSEGNWTDLFATSFNWMLLDFTFFLLGVNSGKIIPSMFNTPSTQGTYSKLLDGEWHSMVATSIGAVLGGAIAIKVMNKTKRGASTVQLLGDCMTIHLKYNLSRKDLQTIGFLVLAVLFPIVGALYLYLLGTSAVAWIVVLYVLCHLFYNLGPNTTTFIVCTLSCTEEIVRLTSIDTCRSLPDSLSLYSPRHICCFWQARVCVRPSFNHRAGR